MTKKDFFDLNPGEVLVKITTQQKSEIEKAINSVINLQLSQIERNRKENPDYEYKAGIDKILQENYTKWCNLLDTFQNSEV